MTTPKPPARPGLSRKPDTTALNNTINELENLITDKAGAAREKTGNTGVPVLDDLIDPEETESMEDLDQLLQQSRPTDHPAPLEYITHEQLEQIIDNVEEKLAGELDALVNILKDTIKDSIMNELKTQLDSGLKKTGNETPDDNPSR